MTITHKSTDDNSATGDGVIYWFDINGEVFGLCRGAVDDDGHEFPESWVDVDGFGLDCPETLIAPADMRAMQFLTNDITDETPPAPTSEVLDDYEALCVRRRRKTRMVMRLPKMRPIPRPGMDAVTSFMRQTLEDQHRVYADLSIVDPRVAGEWLGGMVGDMMQAYDEFHLRLAGSR